MTQVPRVAGGREAQRLGGHRRAQLGHVGAAQRDEAGRQELPGKVGRHRPGQLPQRPEAPGGHLTRDEAAQVLEHDRHAAERAVGQRARGLGPRLVEPGPDHRVQPGVDRLDPADRRLYQVLRADLAAAHEVGLRGGIQPGHIGHAWHATVPAAALVAEGER